MVFSYQVGTGDVPAHQDATFLTGDFADNAAFLAQQGYTGAELMTIDPDAISWDGIKNALRQNGLRCVLVCSGELGAQGYNVSCADEQKREESIRRICRLVDFAAFLGAGINAGRIKGEYEPGVPKEDTWRRAAEGFARVCGYAAQKQVTVALETAAFVYMNFINTCAEAAMLIDEVGRPNFGMMLDIFHMYVEEKNLLSAIKDYGAYNFHVHLADSNRKYPGGGGMNFERILSAFRAGGYNGAFTVECRQLPTQREAARRAAQHLLPILQRVYA